MVEDPVVCRLGVFWGVVRKPGVGAAPGGEPCRAVAGPDAALPADTPQPLAAHDNAVTMRRQHPVPAGACRPAPGR
jgi:hypothetical protein